MQSNLFYKKFSDRLTIRAIIGIIGFVLIIVTLILFELFPVFGIYFFSVEKETFFYSLIFIVGIIDIIFAFLVLNSVKNLKPEAEHIHFTQFHSKFLVGVIISVTHLAYRIVAPFIYPFFVNPIIDMEAYIAGLYLVSAGGFAIGFTANVILMNAWAHFLRYAKLKKSYSKLIQNINLVKTGYLFLTISFLIEFFMSIFYLFAEISYPMGILMRIIGWSLYVGNILFMIIPPLLLIIGRFQLSKTIKNTRFSSSQEPTLGDFSAPQFTQKERNRKYCRSCGASALQEAKFCPNCGNSF